MIITHVWTVQAGTESERWREWGSLKDNHHWQYEFKEKIEENADDEVQRGDFGEFEEDDSESEPEEYEINETETNRESDEFFINCSNCNREIEFGWSELDRRGLILPVESSDFDPLESCRIQNIRMLGSREAGSKPDISRIEHLPPPYDGELNSPVAGCSWGMFVL